MKNKKYYDIKKISKMNNIQVFRIRRTDYRFRLECQLDLYEDLLKVASFGYTKKELVKYINCCIEEIKEILK